MKYRCPVDDVVFDTKKVDREPTLEGHPECPGPECRANFKGYPGAGEVTPINAPAPKPQAAAGNGGGPVSVLDAPPAGQGW
jgi:hypothetical protein